MYIFKLIINLHSSRGLFLDFRTGIFRLFSHFVLLPNVVMKTFIIVFVKVLMSHYPCMEVLKLKSIYYFEKYLPIFSSMLYYLKSFFANFLTRCCIFDVFSSILLPSILILTMVLSCCYLFFLRSYKIPENHKLMNLNYTFKSIRWRLRYIREYLAHLTSNNRFLTILIIFLRLCAIIIIILIICSTICLSYFYNISFNIRIYELFISEYLFQICLRVIIQLFLFIRKINYNDNKVIEWDSFLLLFFKEMIKQFYFIFFSCFEYSDCLLFISIPNKLFLL